MNKMKKSAIVTCGLVVLLMSTPKLGNAMTNAEIEKRLSEIQKIEAKNAKDMQANEKQKKDIAVLKKQEANSLEDIKKEIEEQGRKLNEIQQQLIVSKDTVKQTNEQLQEAEQRVESRDHLLKNRVRLMYTNGFVSYMEVLFEATSFSDFLDRYHALQAIVSQDKEILQTNKKDKAAVAQKKVQVEAELASIQTHYAEREKAQEEMQQKEKDKEAALAKLAKQEEQTEHFTEEQEEYARKLAEEKSKLWAEKQKNDSKNKPAAVYTGGALSWPLPGRSAISSGFINRINPVTKKNENHKGIDIPAPAGTQIHAAAPGTVIIAQWMNGYGNTIVIDHGGGLQTWYGHARSLAVDEGTQVKAGDVVSYVGSTGQSTGNHLHFEVRKNSVPVDPIPYVSGK